MDNIYDVIIIGAGPAGLTAGIYCSRKKLKTLLISFNVGGQALETEDIENYPGFKLITGKQLIERFESHIEEFGVEIKEGIMVKEIKKAAAGGWLVATDQAGEISGKTIIIATGRTPRELPLENVKKYLGKGLSYCATCDAPFYKDKIVVVVGGGNAGAETIIDILPHVAKIYWLEMAAEFKADASYLEKIKAADKVEMLPSTKVIAINGESTVESVNIETNGQAKTIEVDGVFVEIGSLPATEFLAGLLELNEKKEIKIDHHNQTSVPGIFAAGDVTDVLDKQIIVAAGEGAKAALSTYLFLQK